LGNAVLFAFLAGERTHRIDEGDDRQLEAIGHHHQPVGLAITLWPGHAEIMLDARVRVVAALMPQNNAGPATETPDAADERQVLRKTAVAGQWREFGKQSGDIVAGARTARVTGNLNLLCAGQLRIDLLDQFIETGLKL